jgi:hypothetical protein
MGEVFGKMQGRREKQVNTVHGGMICMTAFDQAWALLKMPIQPYTIREVDAPDFESVYHADFYDPESDETLPMEVGISGEYNSIEGLIRDSNQNKPNRTRAFARYDEGDQRVMNMKDVETSEPFRRRGYASGLYDLMAYALSQRKKPYRLEPDTSQSQEAHEMWNAKAPSGHWPPERAWRDA